MTQQTLFITIWVVIMIAAARSTRKRGIHEVQMTLTGMGILGTFVGIVYGLMQFDTANIEQAVPQLLDGLKFSFITSIAGMAFSMIVGVFSESFGWFKDKEGPTGGKSESDLLVEVLGEMKKLNGNIAGEGEASLTTQIGKLRMTFSDKQDELKTAFNEFAETMAKTNTEELIKSIQTVMEDFNTKINDQLGDSFKELSNSVTSLVEWQKNYAKVVQSSTEALSSAQESLSASADSLNNTSEKVSEIAQNNQIITGLNEEFTSVLEKLNQMLGTSVEFSQGMKALSDELEGSGEAIRKEVNDIVVESMRNMETSMNDSTKTINSMVENFQKTNQESNEKSLKDFEQINMKTLQEFGGNLASISGKLATDFKRVQEALAIRTEV